MTRRHKTSAARRTPSRDAILAERNELQRAHGTIEHVTKPKAQRTAEQAANARRQLTEELAAYEAARTRQDDRQLARRRRVIRNLTARIAPPVDSAPSAVAPRDH